MVSEYTVSIFKKCYEYNRVPDYALEATYIVRQEGNVFNLSVCPLGGEGGYPLVFVDLVALLLTIIYLLASTKNITEF